MRFRSAWLLVLVPLLAVSACTGSTSAPPPPAATGGNLLPLFTLTAPKDLRFRPVLQQAASTPGVGGSTNRQPTDTAAQTQAFTGYGCGRPDSFADHDVPSAPLITCDRPGKTKYLLGPTVLDGTQTRTASAAKDPYGTDYVVTLSFNPAGTRTWANYTTAHVNQQVAVVVDTEVVSAPTIQSAILGGNMQISGNFSQQQAQQLADALNRR